MVIPKLKVVLPIDSNEISQSEQLFNYQSENVAHHNGDAKVIAPTTQTRGEAGSIELNPQPPKAALDFLPVLISLLYNLDAS